MATPQLSPGVLVREVDLTVGRADNVLDNTGAIAGPFPIGPVNEATDIATEQDLINVFGKPKSTDNQYSYWMSASSYLSYGGVLKVVRVAGATLSNANAAVGVSSVAMTGAGRIDNYDDYIANHSEASNFNYASKNPGTWANGLKVCVIDDFADQTLSLTEVPAAAAVGNGVSVSKTDLVLPGAGTTTLFTGYIKGIVTSINQTTNVADVKIVSRVTTAGVETKIDYEEGAGYASFSAADSVAFLNSSGAKVGASHTVSTAVDWYDQQTLGLTNATTFWKSIAPRPVTNKYCLDRQSKGDGIHVVVVDDDGTITGIQGNILEKHLNLSKALDSVSAVNSPQKIWYEQFIADYSQYVYAGGNPSSAADSYWGTTPAATGFTLSNGNTASYVPITTADGLWGQDAQGITFSATGATTYKLINGTDYSGAIGTGTGMKAELADSITGYGKFANEDEIEVDYIIMGPGCDEEYDSQAKANYVISLANARKDCMATVGPHRASVVGVTNSDTQTNNLISYFSTLSSSSYAVFDSGYKWTWDRYNNKFRYMPTNPDVAGLMVRTDIEQFPWFSPAGQQRGNINNSVKLAYNPTKAQRDQLYENRINPITNLPGQGAVLFGDKTGLSYASAFDRINVRRLFITVESALQGVANAQLFEFNDEITRSNFVNIVEPYLRDVQSKRGLIDFRVICDQTNNTPEVIDNNEFRADIFLKPTRSINYVTLTFVATRTGISFEEVTGRV